MWLKFHCSSFPSTNLAMAEGPEVVTEGKREALPVTPRLSPQGSPVSGWQDEKLVPCEIHVCVLGCVSGGGRCSVPECSRSFWNTPMSRLVLTTGGTRVPSKSRVLFTWRQLPCSSPLPSSVSLGTWTLTHHRIPTSGRVRGPVLPLHPPCLLSLSNCLLFREAWVKRVNLSLSRDPAMWQRGSLPPPFPVVRRGNCLLPVTWKFPQDTMTSTAFALLPSIQWAEPGGALWVLDS